MTDERLLGRLIEESPTWENSIKGYFSREDIDHMLIISRKWDPPLDLSSYDSVKINAARIYSSVSSNPPRMPPAPATPWSHDMVQTFLRWMYAGCP